jgi:hypothetical protein
MKIKYPVNIALGIIVEVFYTLCIMLAAFLICLAISFKI